MRRISCWRFPSLLLSESRLYHLFRKEMWISPIKYRNEIRVEKAANELRVYLKTPNAPGRRAFFTLRRAIFP